MHKSPNDNNLYDYFILPNKLRVLLAQTSEKNTKSIASLVVNVGHFDDPIDKMGLTHFLEHMLFLGTEKYPQIDAFQKFVKNNGGVNNAWTGTEHSCYFFDISHSAFEPALDQFAQFFIAPLFDKTFLQKEINTIESEYLMKLNDDSRRILQVKKETINQEHPFSKFSVGNKNTLSNDGTNGLRNKLFHFYQTHFSSDLMTLVLLSPLDIDLQKKWIVEKFAEIKNNRLAPKVINVPYVKKTNKQQTIFIEPIRDIKKLSINFFFPALKQHYRTKPLSLIASQLDYEGKGSLAQILKENGLIHKLSAGIGLFGSNYEEFNINCDLTDKGLTQTDDIIETILEYIQKIKKEGLTETFFSEQKAVLDALFRFQESPSSVDRANYLAMNMQYYEKEDILYAPYAMSVFDQSLCLNIAEQLTPDNMRVIIIAKNQHCDKKAKWYHTPYRVQHFSDAQRHQYQKQSSGFKLSISPINPFISYQLEPCPLEKPDIEQKPHLLVDEAGYRLWHLQSTQYHSPKGIIYIAIDSPHSVSSVRHVAMTRLCVEMFLDSLVEDTYHAEVAGLNYHLYTHQGGMTLTLSGFTQNQIKLLQLILNKFRQRDFNKERFNKIKNLLIKKWANAAKDRPIGQIVEHMSGMLQPNLPASSELLAAITDIELKELPKFVDKLFSKRFIEIFTCGNYQQSDALLIGQLVQQEMMANVEKSAFVETFRPLVQIGKMGTLIFEKDCHQDDSAIVIYYQSPTISAQQTALYNLAVYSMSAAFFNQIRTKQQLGYMVGCSPFPLNRHSGIVLYVQSPNASPDTLTEAIDDFLNQFFLILLELSQKQWDDCKEGLINQLCAPDNSLKQFTKRFWISIGHKDYAFSERENVRNEILKISRADMIRFVSEEIKPVKANRFVVFSKGKRTQDNDLLKRGKKVNAIEDLHFKT